MALTPLSHAQQSPVSALTRSGRIQHVQPDVVRAAAFMAAAADRMAQLPLLTSESVQYDLAYDAAHDVGEALLAAYGYRTSNGPGRRSVPQRQPWRSRQLRNFTLRRRDLRSGRRATVPLHGRPIRLQSGVE